MIVARQEICRRCNSFPAVAPHPFHNFCLQCASEIDHVLGKELLQSPSPIAQDWYSTMEAILEVQMDDDGFSFGPQGTIQAIAAKDGADALLQDAWEAVNARARDIATGAIRSAFLAEIRRQIKNNVPKKDHLPLERES